MPKRPHSHRIEKESTSALENLMNSENWVFESFVNDYGIDGRIEIFQDDRATGKIFFVQIKATSETNLGKALKIQLEIETIAYWLSIGTPVCLVRYLDSSKKFYFRWLENFSEIWGRDQSQSTITLHWKIEDEFSGVNSFEDLDKDFTDIERVRSGRKISPFSISLNFHGEFPKQQAIRDALTKSAKDFASIYQVRKEADFTVYFFEKHAEIKYKNIASQTFPLPNLLTYDIEKLAFDAFGMAGILLLNLSRHQESALIFVQLLGKSHLIDDIRFYPMLRSILAENITISDFINHAENYLKRCDVDSAQFLLSAAIPIFKESNETIREKIVSITREIVKQSRSMNSNRDHLGATMFNLATALRQNENFDEALAILNIAFSLDFNHTKRYHWWMEKGRIEFLSGRYSDALTSYKNSFKKYPEFKKTSGLFS